MQDAGIVRSRSKIEATIGNARAYLAMQAAGEDFSEFIWGMAGGKPIVNKTGKVPTRRRCRKRYRRRSRSAASSSWGR
jgi:DNA-3-methyladenine glycosylase I